MYKVVLLDDEPWSIIDLKETMPWERFNMEVIADFDNPLEAYKAISHLKPDILFTDIRMPGMTGVELIKKLKDEEVDCIFVILSAYAEFELARQAVSVGAFEYLLKPINEQSGIEILQRISTVLKPKSEEAENADTQNIHLNRITNYIDINLHKKISLQEVADNCHITKSYCCRLLRKHLDTTFVAYILKKRMEYAVALMSNPQLNMSEIAERAGFEDYFYFSKSFKKYYNSPPMEYRKKLSNKL